jgi:hypothetical protein
MTAKKVFRVLIGEQQGFYVDTEAVSADEAMENICARLLRSSRSYKRLGRSYHPVRASSRIRFCPAQPSHFPKPAISLLAAGAAPASAKRRLAGGPTDRTPPAAANTARALSGRLPTHPEVLCGRPFQSGCVRPRHVPSRRDQPRPAELSGMSAVPHFPMTTRPPTNVPCGTMPMTMEFEPISPLKSPSKE